jgi:[acyl-carrier-protein] S-malonyltransferase
MIKTALLFAGQGAQVVGMGKDLVEKLPSAKDWLEKANHALGYDLGTVCFYGPESELIRTENAQPGIFLASWMAFQSLREKAPSLEYQATAGLSLGEFTALAASGFMTFEEGIRLVRQRGRFMQEACDTTRGSMAAIIGLDEAVTREVCAEAGVALANLNCPGQLVISGEVEKIQQACELAKSRGARKALPLTVAGAYHSPLMASAQSKLEAELTLLQPGKLDVPVISNVTALPHEERHVKERLIDQITHSVRWEDSMRYLLAQGFTRFIELGPGTALSGFMKRISKEVQLLNISDLGSLESTSIALQNNGV